MISRDDFVTRFGGVFEHSPFIAERAYDAGNIAEPLTSGSVYGALVAIFRAASADGKNDILAAFETRIGNDRDAEFATATAQVEKIALLRLQSMLPET
jgi:2-oxo-4-hydroxy-4-carboxy--5-ureidoimidazoline (OHCU) decarboxylase